MGFGSIPSNSVLHLAFQICHEVTMHVSHFDPCPFCCSPRLHHKLSRHSVTSCTVGSSLLVPSIVVHTGSVHLHPITMCSRDSFSPHTGHPGSTTMPRLMRFIFTANAFVASRHTKFFALGTMFAPQISFHRPSSVSFFRPWFMVVAVISRSRW